MGLVNVIHKSSNGLLEHSVFRCYSKYLFFSQAGLMLIKINQSIVTFMMGMLLISHFAQATEPQKKQTPPDPGQWVTVDADGYQLSGKLLSAPDSPTAVLIIAGSGPTDHNGNIQQMGMTNNSYLMLAEGLHAAGYAVLRVDKRGIGRSANVQFKPEQALFGRYVADVVAWIRYLKTHHTKVVVMGHSLGGLMAIQAAQQESVDQLIMLASVAASGHDTIKRQMTDQPEFVSQAAIPLLERLRQGEKISADEVPPYLYSLMGPAIQPYLRSFMNIEPRAELAAITTPTLVIIGDTDIQITVAETMAWVKDLDHVESRVITGMNHVLKPAPADRTANLATYSQADLPLHPDLLPTIIAFLAEK